MAKAKTRRRRLPMPVSVIARPKLFGAIVLGLVVGGALTLFSPLPPATCVVLGWDAGAGLFCGISLWHMYDCDQSRMRARAAQDDEGRAVTLAIVVGAAAFSLAAVAGQLAHAKTSEGLGQALYVALAFATVALSWFLAQLAFAVHYAHAYYDRRSGGRGDAQGLLFPGGEGPDYWDFLHFAVIIGVACQTADVQITSKALRRLSTTHSLFAFAFNTVVVALTINLLAGLIQ
jgi:uncharacterized membrane protein